MQLARSSIHFSATTSRQIVYWNTEHIKPSKENALRLYKRLRRFGLEWKGTWVDSTAPGGRTSGASITASSRIEQDSVQEQRDYILKEARQQIEHNKLSTTNLETGYRRMELAEHYGLPYEKPVYYATGHVIRKHSRKKE